MCAHCGYDESAPRSAVYLPHGTVLGGQYRIGRVLGRPGGFGITYLGWDIYLQQKVAIKEFMPPELAVRVPQSLGVTVFTQEDRRGFESGKEFFLREARLVAGLSHPNVVRVRNFFNANDTAYLVMDYYEGLTIEDYLTAIRPTVDPHISVALTCQVLDGLDCVHRNGFVHRDVKPHNIYLASVGRPILLDFGAARQAVGEQVQSYAVMYTAGFAPLEQHQRRGAMGPWTDVYSAAATLVRMLTGKPPPIATERVTRDELPALLLEAPEPLRPVLTHALELDPARRIRSAADFKTALAAVESQLSASETPAAFIVAANAQRPSEPMLENPPPREQAPPQAADSPRVGRRKRASPAPSAWPVTRPARVKRRATQRARLRSLLMLSVVAVVATAIGYLAGHPVGHAPSAEPPSTPVRLAKGLPNELIAAVQPPRWVAIPQGSYVIQPPDSTFSQSQAMPVPAFRIADAEVTVGQFRQFVTLTGYSNTEWATRACEGGPAGADWAHPGFHQGDDDPVVCVSAHDASAYVQWLARQISRPVRLPTEAEWDWAARAGTRTLYWWGNDPDRGAAACVGCGGRAPSSTHPVRALRANPWGLYGSADNASEITCSRFDPAGSVAALGCSDDQGPRAVRGGSWHDSIEALRSDERRSMATWERNAWTGFRLALTGVSTTAPAAPPSTGAAMPEALPPAPSSSPPN